MSTVVESVPPQATSLKRPREEEADLPQPLVAMDNINTDLIKAEYAVRGAIVDKADQFARRLAAGEKLPFDKLVYCNIGNPQQLGQKPITFVRQVVALCDYPELRDQVPEGTFPADVVARSDAILADVVSSGAYTASKGALACRKLVAAGMEARDGFPADPEDLYMTDGASPAVHGMLKLLIRSKADAFLVPIPQYPLYSAGIQLAGGQLVPYYLNEAAGWGLDADDLAASLAAGKAQGLTVRAMVVINPGNPTGQCLSLENQRQIVRFCCAHNLVLLADEVYQTNVYVDTKAFHSFKRVACEMGAEAAGLQLVSLHSVSKGFMGECGRRGGYMELVGMDAAVKEQLLKAWSVNLCPNVSGQIAMACTMSPPQPGDPSYELYAAERDAVFSSLARRAAALSAALNQLEGVTCQRAEGAMYCFPSLRLPPAAVEAAAARGQAADFLYCMECLEATGIVMVPGSGFRQRAGTWHFRTTFLPSEEDIGRVIESLTAFHSKFLKKYRD
mmetsp:Transcript_44465/g.115050  ORF Transcript_44465/g.115050 Transcript_44465/m.115050 type:complete len:504 (-) Transcript_44465:315-1826(-)